MICELAVMDTTGDNKQIWDPDVAEEVEAAESTFKRLKKKGYMAYRVTGDGSKGEAMAEFDPRAGKVIMAPAMRGG